MSDNFCYRKVWRATTKWGAEIISHFGVSNTIYADCRIIFSGTRSASENTGDMFFHGKHVITAALEDLTSKFGLAKARSITLVGTGSGARGVGYNCDYVSRYNNF